jgi:hypothetical protein
MAVNVRTTMVKLRRLKLIDIPAPSRTPVPRQSAESHPSQLRLLVDDNYVIARVVRTTISVRRWCRRNKPVAECIAGEAGD